jgi:hypothetical protein
LKEVSNPGTAELAQPSYFMNLITKKFTDAVYQREYGSLTDVAGTKEELLGLITTMQTSSGGRENIEAVNAAILALEQQRAQLEMNASPPIKTITADEPCYFVSHADGYEPQLNKDSIDSLTVDFINSVSDYGTEKAMSQGIIGKTIQGFEWYIAGVTDNSKNVFMSDDKVSVKFESVPNILQGTVNRIIATDNPKEHILVVACTDLIPELVRHRTENVEVIKEHIDGLKVPREAVRFRDITEITEDGNGNASEVVTTYRGAYVKFGEKISFKKMDVIFEAEDYVLTRADMRGDYVALYDEVVVGGTEINVDS